MLDVDALHLADPLGEGEHLGLAERLGGVPAALELVDDRRVEALLDRRPDRERRCEVVAVDDEVGAVTDADLVDLAEQFVGGVAGRDVGEPGLDTHADERHQAAVLPRRVFGELTVAEPDPGLRERVGRVRHRQVHRHVDVVAAGGERAAEDRRVEAGVAGVEDHVGLHRPGEFGDGVLRRRVDERRDDPSSPRRSSRWRPAPSALAMSMSATVMCEYASRFDAIATKADPTPPAPTTRTRMSRGYFDRPPPDRRDRRMREQCAHGRRTLITRSLIGLRGGRSTIRG